MPVIDLIQARRGSAAAWTAGNPVLAAGEMGFELDTGKHKIGDGSTAWVTLPYFLNETGLNASFLTALSANGYASLAAAVAAANALGDRLFVDLAGTSQAVTTLALNAFTKLRGGKFTRASGTAALLTIPTTVTLAGRTLIVEDVEVDGVTSVAGNVGVQVGNHGRVELRNVSAVNEGDGFNLLGTQFGVFYSLKAHACKLGIYLANLTTDGGGNSNLFTSPQAILGEVGMLIDCVDLTMPMVATELLNPQFLVNSLCALAAFDVEHLHVRGWAAELNGTGGTASAAYHSRTVKRSSVYLNNSTAVFDGGYVADNVDPCFLIENGSHLVLRDMTGYGLPYGVLAAADASSGVTLQGVYGCIGTVHGVRRADVDVISPQGLLAGPAAINETTNLPNDVATSQQPGFSSTDGATSSTTGTDTLHGAYDQVTYAATPIPGTPDLNRIRRAVTVAGPFMLAVTVQASVDTTLNVQVYPNVGSKLVTLLAGEWTRLVWWSVLPAAGSVDIVIFATDAAEATVKFCKWQVVSGAADDRYLRTQWNRLVSSNYRET